MDTDKRFGELESKLFRELHSYHIELRTEIMREVNEQLERFQDRMLVEAGRRNKQSAFVQRPGHDGTATETELRQHYSQLTDEPTEQSSRLLNTGFPHVSNPWDKEATVVQQFNEVEEGTGTIESTKEIDNAQLDISAVEQILERAMTKLLNNFVVVPEEPAQPATITEVVVPGEEVLYQYSYGNYDPLAYQRSARSMGNF